MGRTERIARKSLYVLSFLIFTVLVGTLIVLQQRGSGAHMAEFSATSRDEAAHYLSGVMVMDYMAEGFPALGPFLSAYELHFPAMEMGRWPPFYALMEGIWFSVLSPSTPAALLLPALICALLVVSAGWAVARSMGVVPGVAVGLVLFALPLVREATLTIGLDLPAALIMLWAALAFGRFMDRGRRKDALIFGALAGVAILTKAVALGLVLVPPLAILMGRRFDLLRRRDFWLPLPLMALIAGPWTLLTLHMGWHAGASELPYPVSPAVVEMAARLFADEARLALGGLMASLGLLGILMTTVRAWGDELALGRWVAMGALALSTFAALVLMTAAPESGRLLPLVAPLVMLAAFAAVGLLNLALSGWNTVNGLVVSLILLAATLPGLMEPVRKGAIGMNEAAEAILAKDAPTPLVVVGADARGEGALVAAMAQRDRDRRSHVMPGSRLLPEGSALAREAADALAPATGARLPPGDTTRMMEGLDRLGVGFLVLDTSPEARDKAANRLLADTAAAYPDRFQALGLYPRSDAAGAAQVYSLVGNMHRAPDLSALAAHLKARPARGPFDRAVGADPAGGVTGAGHREGAPPAEAPREPDPTGLDQSGR